MNKQAEWERYQATMKAEWERYQAANTAEVRRRAEAYPALLEAAKELAQAMVSPGYCRYCQEAASTRRYAWPEELHGGKPLLSHTDTCVVAKAQAAIALADEEKP